MLSSCKEEQLRKGTDPVSQHIVFLSFPEEKENRQYRNFMLGTPLENVEQLCCEMLIKHTHTHTHHMQSQWRVLPT